MRHISSLFIFLLISSCGLKVTNEIDDNVLLGSWNLDKIYCYKPNDLSTYVEDYDISGDPDLSVSIDFINSDIQYMVSTPGCSTSATGKYNGDFNGTGTGLVDIYQVVLGATTTCDVSIPFFDNDGTPKGDGTVNFTMNSNFSKSLTWSISEDRNTLTLDLFTGFKGSSSVVFSCESRCNCSGLFSRR